MKTEQEMINELAMILCKHIRDCGEIDCKTCPFKGCMSQRQAKEILDRGYRKASVVVDEFVERLKAKESPKLLAWEYGEGYLDCIKTAEQLADEMRKEVEK